VSPGYTLFTSRATGRDRRTSPISRASRA
jgi:hypothetical protein